MKPSKNKKTRTFWVEGWGWATTNLQEICMHTPILEIYNQVKALKRANVIRKGDEDKWLKNLK